MGLFCLVADSPLCRIQWDGPFSYVAPSLEVKRATELAILCDLNFTRVEVQAVLIPVVGWPRLAWGCEQVLLFK